METASKTSTLAACFQVFRLSLRRQFFTRQTIVMLVLLALARLAFQSEVSLKQMMTVKAYASVIAMVELILRTPLVLETQTPEVSFGIGSGTLAMWFAVNHVTFVCPCDLISHASKGLGMSIRNH